MLPAAWSVAELGGILAVTAHLLHIGASMHSAGMVGGGVVAMPPQRGALAHKAGLAHLGGLQAL